MSPSRHSSLQVARSRRGVALVASLALAMILIMMGAALLGLAVTQLTVAVRRSYNAAALAAAGGGLDDAIREMKLDPLWNGYASRSLGNADIQVTVVTPPGYPKRRQVTSRGQINTGSYMVSRSVRSVLDLEAYPTLFYNAIASKTDFTINGNVDISSTPAANKGDVHSNGNMKLNGSAVDILGRATASGVITMSGGPNISQGATSGVPPMTFPVVTDEFKERSLANGIYVGNKTVSGMGVLQGKIAGNLTVAASGATINGVVWVTGSVTLDGPLIGNGTIVAEGPITLNARYTYPGTDASKIGVITTSSQSTAVSLTGNRQFKGILYAPEGGISFSGTPTLLGMAAAESITFSGTPDIIRLTDYDTGPPELPEEFAVKGWQEI